MHKQGNNLHYSVRGSGEFPVDMLKYDGCRPASARDQALIDAHIDPYTDSSEEVVVNLVLPNADRRLPHADRWESFRWEVVGSRHVESDAARIARLQAVWDGLLTSLTPAQREAMDYFRPERVI